MTAHHSSVLRTIPILMSQSPTGSGQRMLWRSAVSPRPVPSLCIAIVSHEPWRSACALFAIDIQSVQRFIIFACVTEEEDDGVRDGFSCKKVKDRDGACRQHLVIRIPTDDIHLLLFQNAKGQDF